MDSNSIIDDSTSDVLSTNLRAKAMKRRRVRLGTQDLELEKSTLELLTALRDPPKSKCSHLKPLPAISSNSNLADNFFDDIEKESTKKHELEGDVFMSALSKTVKHKKSRRKPLELQTNGITKQVADCNSFTNSNVGQDILPQSTAKVDLNSNPVRPGRRRKTTLEAKEKSFIDQLDDTIKDPVPKRRPRVRSKEVIDEFSFDMKDKSSPRRPNNKIAAENFGSTPMRNLKLFDDNKNENLQLNDIPFHQNSTKSKIVTRSKRKETESMLGQNSLETLSFLKSPATNNSLTNKNNGLHNLNKTRKPRRNRQSTIGSELNDDVTEKAVDCEGSDVMSVFSDDIADSYDPSMSSNKQSVRRRTSHLNSITPIKEKTFLLCDEQEDSDVTSGGIFTSPKRHKKRSRRATADVENELIPKEKTTEKSKLFLLDKEADELDGFGVNPKPQRRRTHNKYLPPLSQNAKFT